MRASRLRAWDFITTGDLRIMRRCNTWLAPRWVRLWMLYASRGGDGWLWGSIMAVILLVGGEDRFLATGTAAAAGAVGTIVFLLLKQAANRPRPCAIAPHAWATLLPPDQFSFPSGHTMTAFAITTPLMAYYPDLSPLLLFCAASVAASRIVLGMHFLSDVVAGAALGVLLGWISLAVI